VAADGDSGRLPARPDGADHGPDARRRGRDVRRLSAAGLASLVLHLLLLGGIVYVALHRPAARHVKLSPAQQGVRVALVLREQKGAGHPQAPAAPAPRPPQPHPPHPHPPAAQPTVAHPLTPHTAAPQPAAAPPPPAKVPPATRPAPARPDTRVAATHAAAPPAIPAPPMPTPPAQPAPPPPRPQPAPPPQPAPQPAPSTAPARAGFQFNLGGTNSETNAIVRGDAVVPAKPDARFRNHEPVYPDAAARRGEQGTVVLLIHVGPDGRPSGVDVLRSSGFRLLDRAAEQAVAGWHFLPAIRDGQAVPASMPLRVVFSLR